jgi:hypothetical protein
MRLSGLTAILPGRRSSEQWITIRGKDASRPVLLYLGIGGPARAAGTDRRWTQYCNCYV